jgi:cyclase
MRRAAILGTITFAGILVAMVAPFAQEPDEVRALQKVRNNLFVIPGQGGNTAVFVTRTGVVLVDTKNPGNGQAILDRVAAVSDEPVSMIINTHTHGDHVGSNEFFASSVEVVTQENTRANMQRMAEVRDKPQAMPDRTFRDRLTIGSGQDRVDLYYFGPAHTNGDAFVVFPAVRAMHAGDVFAAKGPPLVDTENGGSVAAYADTLDKAVAGIHDVDTVIPGHSAVTTWAEFAAYARYVRQALGKSAR